MADNAIVCSCAPFTRPFTLNRCNQSSDHCGLIQSAVIFELITTTDPLATPCILDRLKSGDELIDWLFLNSFQSLKSRLNNLGQVARLGF